MSESLSPSWPPKVEPCVIVLQPGWGRRWLVKRRDGSAVGEYQTLREAEAASVADTRSRERS